LAEIKTYSEELLVFVDESGIDSYFHREYGWSKKGQLIFGEIAGKRFARESFIAAKNKSHILAPLCFEGTCNTKLFDLWVKQFLVPHLLPGQVVILDNATFHKSAKSRKLIEKAGCRLLFLPPYSPDLNPIEKFWAWFKSKIKQTVHQFSSLSEAIDMTFNNCNFQLK
jgi:transposase